MKRITLGRCTGCTFPADQALFRGLCIACKNRCRHCEGTGQPEVYDWRVRSMVRRGRCLNCWGTGRLVA